MGREEANAEDARVLRKGALGATREKQIPCGDDNKKNNGNSNNSNNNVQ